MDVIIVTHTEFGYVKGHEVIPDKNAVEGVTEGVKNLIKIAEKNHAKITFAIMPEVVKYIPQELPGNTNHEIGLHIHPGWEQFKKSNSVFFVGDKYLHEYCEQSSTSTVLRDYPFNEQYNMIQTGSDLLEDSFGIRPKTFVAGRWSIDNNTIRALIKTKIERDCSAPAHQKAPHYDWSKLPRICMPYHPSTHDYQEKGDLPILIVPISQMFFGGNVNPEVIPSVGLSWLKACFSEYYRQEMPLFHICLHSPCMTNDYFVEAVDELLGFIAQHRNVNFRFASQINEYAPVSPSTQVIPYLRGVNRNIIKLGCKAAYTRVC